MEITNELKAQALYHAIMSSEINNQEYGSYIQTLIENCMNYAEKNNHSKTNWIARELFEDVLEEDLIEMLFDEE